MNTTKKLAMLARSQFAEQRSVVERHREALRALCTERDEAEQALYGAVAVGAAAAEGAGATAAILSLHSDNLVRLRERIEAIDAQIQTAAEALDASEAALRSALQESKRCEAVHERVLVERRQRGALDEQREQDEHASRRSKR